MQIVELFGDLAQTLAQMNPAQVAEMKAPASMAQEVNDLIAKKKEGSISLEETATLERLLALDMFVSLMKAKANIFYYKNGSPSGA
jgi:hypothetical protein